MGELRYGGVAVWVSCGVGKLRFGGVTVWVYCGMGMLQCVGVAAYGGPSGYQALDHCVLGVSLVFCVYCKKLFEKFTTAKSFAAAHDMCNKVSIYTLIF